MKESRAYQLAIEADIPRYAARYGSLIVQAPTGAGKSHVINVTVKRLEKAGFIPLVISDSLKIHRQLVKECNAMKIDSGVSKYFFQVLSGYCYVAMAQTLSRRSVIIEEFRKHQGKVVIIVDECHRNTMSNLVNDISPKFLIGFSATPHFRWAKHLPKLYKSIIVGPQIRILIKDGFLCHYRHVARTGANLEELEVSSNGEYTEESIEKVFSGKKMYDGLFEDLPKEAKGKTLIYVASIKQCEITYSELLARGYKVTRYHSGLDNGEYELAKFTTTHEADICVSVSALTMGWDYPPIKTIVLWRATRSLPLYLQMIGRASRPLTPQEAATRYNLHNYVKEQFTVLDYGGNFDRFGGWDMDRDWAELWQDPKKKRTISTYAGVAGSKMCPVCQALLSLTARSCYNCGYMYPVEEIELIEGKLMEVKNTLEALKERRVGDLSAAELASFAKFYDRKLHAIRVAKHQAQKDPSFLKEFGKAMGYNGKWAERILEELPEEPIDFLNIKIKPYEVYSNSNE
jgi:superfamily II DNA or RNA helicase